MNRWLFSSGAIVSSAMAFYSWTHPSAFNLTLLSAQAEQDSKPLPNEIEGLYDRLLQKARSVATHDKFAEAINTVAGIPKNSRSYGEAQQLQADWTQELFQRASSQYKQANVGMAIWMLKAIPPASQRHARATELQQRWAKDWAALRQATAAQKEGDWKGVMSSVTLLKDTMLYQSVPVQEMLQQATANLYGGDKVLAQISAVPIDPSVTVPAIPTTADLNTASLPQTPPPSPLLINRAQALAWAEPPALMADGSLGGGERSLPQDSASPSGMPPSGMPPSTMPHKSAPSGGLPAPEFVPLEWTPPALAPAMPPASEASRQSVKSESNADGNSGGGQSNQKPQPSSVPSQMRPPLPESIAPADWMALPPIDLLSPLSRTHGIKSDRFMDLRSSSIAPDQLSWSKSSAEKAPGGLFTMVLKLNSQ